MDATTGSTVSARAEAPITAVRPSLYRVATETPESDGTLEWDSTTMVLVEISAGGEHGLGYSYTSRAAAAVIEDTLGVALEARDAMDIPACWRAMIDAIRNLGRPGIASSAIAACDVALHDLKAKLLGVSTATLLGRHHDDMPVYGSGGFTSYSDNQLTAQLGGWAEAGFDAVKMKVGRDPARDVERVSLARQAIGPDVGLFVDANGAYDRKQALSFAEKFAAFGVSWFEEPVSSNDLAGLRLIRDTAPACMEITAGEYGYDAGYFRAMIEAGAVDVLQADATRCAGYTGFLLADAVALACEVPLSSHTAPALHLACCCASQSTRHMEWFFDHVRIERMFFAGTPLPGNGRIAPDLSRTGIGLDFKAADAEAYRI